MDMDLSNLVRTAIVKQNSELGGSEPCIVEQYTLFDGL